MTPSLDLSPFALERFERNEARPGGLRHLTRRTLIVNPYASRVTDERIAEVEARLRPGRRSARSAGPRHRAGAGAVGDEVWVLGGDGVLNETLNGLRDGVALGVVPGWRGERLRALARRAGAPDLHRPGQRPPVRVLGGHRRRLRGRAELDTRQRARAAAAPAISSTDARWRGGSSVDPNRGSRSWGRGAPPRSSLRTMRSTPTQARCRCASFPTPGSSLVWTSPRRFA